MNKFTIHTLLTSATTVVSMLLPDPLLLLITEFGSGPGIRYNDYMKQLISEELCIYELVIDNSCGPDLNLYKNLYELDIKCNLSTDIPPLPNLKILCLTNVTYEIIAFPNLRSLYLSNCIITEISCPNLNYICLYGTTIENLHESENITKVSTYESDVPDKLINVKELYTNHTNFDALEITNLDQLEVFECNDSDIQEIPLLPNLKKLYCTNCLELHTININSSLKSIYCKNCPNLNLNLTRPINIEVSVEL